MLQKLKTFINILEMQRFALVGGLAGITHYVAGIIYIHYNIAPNIVIANILAYFTALIVSIVGHTYFSFNVSLSFLRIAKFCMVSVSAMGISTITVYSITLILPNPSLALIGGIIIASGYTYILSKIFAFT